MVIRRPFDRVRCSIDEFDESRTAQSEKDETDINNIVKKFTRTKKLPEERAGAQYADVSGLNQDLTSLYNLQKQVMGDIARLQREQERQSQNNDEIRDTDQQNANNDEASDAETPATE